jgi:hypothetical protein
MFGVILAAIGSLFDELANSIGKAKICAKEECPYTMGFLTNFWGTIGFAVIGLARHNFIFSSASLHTFLPRLVLEILQAQIVVWAIVKADRSTFGFIRTLTIPLLLMADVLIGYNLKPLQISGLVLIILTLLAAFRGVKINRAGSWLVLFSAVNAVITISLYKYDITHFNSVEAEQMIVYLVLMAYFYLTARIIGRENPFRFLTKPIFFGQASANGVASLLCSFAYKFAPASIVLAAVRSAAVGWTVVSGRVYFKEKHFLLKSLVLIMLIAGIVMLVL